VSSVTVANEVSVPGARSRLHGLLARWAVALSAVFWVAIAVFLIGWTVGGDRFMDNNLWFSVTTVLPGVATAIAAYATAIVALIRASVGVCCGYRSVPSLRSSSF
jgi:hypothetical protein